MLLISKLKIATGLLKSTDAFLAMLNTNAVFPIPGLEAITIKSDFCQPPVILSRAVNPLGTPNKPSF